MKLRWKEWLGLLLMLITLSGTGWYQLNRNAVVDRTAEKSLRKIVSKYHARDAGSDMTFTELSSRPGPNGGVQKTYSARISSLEVATVTINSFLNLGWQEARYQRKSG